VLIRRAVLIASLVLCAALRAPAAVFPVNNTLDSGSNSLRDAVSSATVGANTISWGAGSGGLITLLTDLPAIADQTTLDVSAAPSSVTIIAADLNLSGGVTFLNGTVAQPWTIASTILGVGSMTKTGAGILSLTAVNYYSGGTFLNAGVLNINNSAALGSGAVVVDGGTLQTASTITFSNAISINGGKSLTVDTLGNNSILSGIISGGGTLVNASTGTLILTGANTYTGGTVLNSGVLNINADGALGLGGVTFNGGTLQIGSDVAMSRSLTLNAGGGIIDTQGANLSLSGIIDGAGALTKIGTGILTLSRNNIYGGATSVNAGTLKLNIDNALPGTTALTVANGATLDFGNSNTTVASLTSGGTLKTTLLGPTSLLAVTGNRNITGGTLVVAIAPGQLVANGAQFTVITSGSQSGPGFTNIVAPAAFLFTPAYTATDVKLTASFVPFANSAATGNQGAIGSSLEAMRTAPAGDAATVLTSLYSLDAAQLRAALDQLSPVSLAAMQGVGLAGSGVQAAAVSQRMTALADGGEHPGFASYNVTGNSSYPGTLVATTLGDDNMTPSHGGILDLSSPWGYFASVSATTGRLTEGHSPSGSQPGYSFNSGGLTGGADYRFDEHFTAGGSVGFLKGHSSILSPGSGTVDDNSVRFGGYGAANAGNLHANAYLGGALDFFKTNRGIAFPGISRTATAAPLGKELNISTNLSYDLPTLDWGIWSPFAGLSYDRMMIGSFTEDGAGTLNLAVAPQTAESLQSTLGLRFSEKWTTENHVYTPYFSLGWRHEFDDQSRPVSARFATGVGAPFTVATGRYARDGTAMGVGLTATVSKNVTAKLDYTGDFRSHFVSTIVNADLRLRF
jgi:autotransporter-associated beta strand protein